MVFPTIVQFPEHGTWHGPDIHAETPEEAKAIAATGIVLAESLEDFVNQKTQEPV